MRLFNVCLFILWLNVDESLQQNGIKCKLDLPPISGTSYTPEYTNVFLPGERVKVTCGEKFSIRQAQTADVLCRDDGQWTMQPVCQVVTCIKRAPHVERWSQFWRSSRLYDTVTYYCESGFKKPAGVTKATCTREGWSPEPLCEENGWDGNSRCSGPKCPKAEVANGFVVGPYDDKLFYTCNEGYKLLSGWWGEATCSGNMWVGLEQCIAKADCSLPVIPNGKATPQKTHYKENERIQITCDRAHVVENNEATCTRGAWNKNLKESCRRADRRCTAPHKVENAFPSTPYQREYLSGSEVTYRCHDGFKVNGDGTIRCQDGVWEKKTINCSQAAGCGTPPILPDGDVRHTVRSEYNHSEQVEYMCQPYYTMEGDPYRTCEDGEWTGHMRCLKPCVMNDDDIRRHNITVKFRYKKFLIHDDVIEFGCSTGKPAGSLAMRQRCNSGQLPLPSCS